MHEENSIIKTINLEKMKVSVLMPVYNGAQYLQEAIDSILNQTYRDFELIIVDDGSTDDSPAIIYINAERDNRVVSLKNEQNSGICVTLNKGLDAAKGEYIIRMDCDDISELDRIEKQVAFMETHSEYGLLGSNIRVFGDGIETYVFDFDEDWRMCIADMIFATCVAHPAIIMRKKLIQKYHLRYDDSFRGMEDYYMWWQIAKYAKISNLQEPLLNYRYHQKQVTQKKVDDKHRAMTMTFIKERLIDLQISLTEQKKILLMRYIYSDFQYSDNEMKEFIMLCKKILLDIKKHKPELISSAKLVMAKAISQSVNKSGLITMPRKKYYYQAYFQGCMPTMWFIKSCLHQIIGR